MPDARIFNANVYKTIHIDYLAIFSDIAFVYVAGAVFLALMAVTLVASTAFAQTGARLIDYNAKSSGRAGTSIGFFDSPALMMSNPAGISMLNESMLDVNLSVMFPTMHFKNDINDVDGESNTFMLPSISFVSSSEDSDFSWGLGFFTTGGMGADFKLNHPLYIDQNGAYVQQDYHSMFAVMQGGVTIAYEVAPGISLGLTGHGVYSMMEFQMPFAMDPAIMTGAVPGGQGMTFGDMFSADPPNGFGYSEVVASANMTDLVAISYQGKFGVAFDLGGGISFGVSYTSSTPLDFENGKAEMDMTSQFNDAFMKGVQGYMMQNPGASQEDAMQAVRQQFTMMGFDLEEGMEASYDVTASFALPQTFGAGFMYEASESFRLALDVEYLQWADAFDKMEIRMTGGQNSNINLMMGGTEGEIAMDFPLEWEDSYLVKLGGEFDASDHFILRAGYAYNSNPVPDATVFPLFPAIVEHHLTLGGSYDLAPAPLAFHLAFEYGVNNSQTGANPSKIGSEYSGATTDLATMLLHAAVTWTF